MPRGSKPGERRGGRQRTTPNRRTVLADRILAAVLGHPTATWQQLVVILLEDSTLPADVRMAIARECLPAQISRSAKPRAEKSPLRKRQQTEPASLPRAASPPDAGLTQLYVLFSIAKDPLAGPAQRRKAAVGVAQHFLPKRPGITRSGAVSDEHGFVIDPQIAREYRDSKLRLRALSASPRASSLATERRANKLRARVKTILQRLQCPCPSRYGESQRKADSERLMHFAHQRRAKTIFSEADIAEEAHLRARVDCFDAGPEQAARQRLRDLRDQERSSGNGLGRPLTLKEQTDLRVLAMHYPTAPISRYDEKFDEFSYHPLRDAPIATDGNLYPVPTT